MVCVIKRFLTKAEIGNTWYKCIIKECNGNGKSIFENCAHPCHSLKINIALPLLQFCFWPFLSTLRLTLQVMVFSSFTTLDLGSFPGSSLEPSLCSFLLLTRMVPLGEPMEFTSLFCAASKSPVALLAP